MSTALEVIGGEFPTVTDFERAFPSLCFALATGVGKTRLMGACISYLHLEHGICNFFVLAPNLTVYNKLIGDFTENTPKYVFKGIHAFATEPPQIVTGDNYEQRDPMSGRLFGQVQINIFNIAKISSEVRGGRSPRIRLLSEYIGESYFDYLSGLDDLVMLMDESHRYRASAGMRAINELKPILGLELTATPFVETSRGPVQFKNVIYDYPLARAMEDGFVKEPAVVTQKDFDPSRFSQAQLEQVKLEDYLVRGLIDFDDISYDDHAELLYDLAGQVVSHLSSYLDEEDVRNVLQYYERQLVELIHTRMQTHQWEEEADYEVKVSKGFTELKESAFTASEGNARDFRQTVENKSKIGQYVFGGFSKCLYEVTKFDSDSERLFAVVLETDPDVHKWFRPAKGQFQLYYKSGVDHREYQPDFVVETREALYMCEPKQRKELRDSDVLAKKEAAERWCEHATDHTATYGGKPWHYALIAHDAIAANMRLRRLAGAG